MSGNGVVAIEVEQAVFSSDQPKQGGMLTTAQRSL